MAGHTRKKRDKLELHSSWKQKSLPQSSKSLCSPNLGHARLVGSTPKLRGTDPAQSFGQSRGSQLANCVRNVFGTPSYPSPLDRIRTGRRERAVQLGLTPTAEESFELNQSFPKRCRSRHGVDIDFTPDSKKKLGDFTGNGMNDVSFSPGMTRGSFNSTLGLDSSAAGLSDSWSFYSYIGGGETGATLPTTVRNPNKAIVTVDATTTQILTANEMACELFEFSQEELLGVQLSDLLTSKSKAPSPMSESHLGADGEIIEVSGKVMDAVDSTGMVVTVSVWAQRINIDPPRSVVVLEPVERTTACVTFDSTGTILDCDSTLAYLHGYAGADEVMGLKIDALIPAYNIPTNGTELSKDVRKQRATGRTRDGATFPLSIYIKHAEIFDRSNDSSMLCRAYDSSYSEEPNSVPDDDAALVVTVYRAVLWVFANISGLVTFLPDGTIHSINENFALILFGYPREELLAKNISFLFPNFYDDIDRFDTSSNSQTSFVNGCHDDNKVLGGTGERNCGPHISHSSGSEDQGIGRSVQTTGEASLRHDSAIDSSLDVSLIPYMTHDASLPSSSLTGAGQVEDVVEPGIMKSTEALHSEEETRLSDTTRPASQPTVVVIDTVVNDTQDTDEESDNVNTRPVSHQGDAPVVIDTVVNGIGDTQDNCEESDINMGPVSDQGDVPVIVGASDDNDSKIIVTVKHDNIGDTHTTLDCGDGQLAVKPCDDDVTVAGSDVIVDSAQLLGPAGDRAGSVNAVAAVDETGSDDIRLTGNEGTNSVEASLKDREDTNSPDHNDTKLQAAKLKEDREDTRLLDHMDTKLNDQYVMTLLGQNDANLKDQENKTLADQVDTSLKDHVDTQLTDCKDTDLSDHVDTNLKDQEDTNLKDCVDTNLPDHKNTTLSDHKDTNVLDREDNNIPDHENIHMAGCVNTSLVVEKETILQDAGPQHVDTVVMSEKVTDVNENCDTDVVTEKTTDRGDTVQVTGDDIQKVDVAMESLDINDKAENGGIDIDTSGRSSDLGEERSGVPTGIVITSNNTKHADSGNNADASTSVHSTTNEKEETPVATKTIPTGVPDISVTVASCVHSDSNDTEVGVTTVETTESCQHVTDDDSGSNGRMSPLVMVSDADGHIVDTTPTCTDIDQLNAMTANLHLSATSSTSTPLNCRSAPRVGIDGDASLATQLELDVFAETPEKVSPVKGHHVRSPRTVSMKDGDYKARSCHRDGSFIGVVFQLKRVELDDGQSLYCLWVSRDQSMPGEGSRSYASLTMASSFNSTLDGITRLDQSSLVNDSSAVSLGTQLATMAKHELSDSRRVESPSSPMVSSNPISPQDGPYAEAYVTLQSIGKGAFGFVKLAKRRTDGREVVTKFIKRKKVLKDCWIDDPEFGRIPLEVSLLTKLVHPNIVEMLNFYEMPDFFVMVMEKHGTGMDLFEFIDRCPILDEPLISYIFRQMLSAVSYLHDFNILHRDIKDENIILSESFHVKLIDFGSAAFMQPGKLFGTFCGTMEYCSPEVLKGNKYRGPELEMWSLGVTLYTLVFSENPFYDIDETIQCVLRPPYHVSDDLMEIIAWLLHPNESQRATLQDIRRDPWVQQPIRIDDYKWKKVLPNCEFYGNTAGDHRTVSPEHTPDGARRSTSFEGDSPLNDDNAGASDDSDIVELNDDLQRFLILDDREMPRQTEEIY